MVRVIRFRLLCILFGAFSLGTGPTFALGQPASRSEYVVYHCRYKSVAEIQPLLADLLPEDPSVHLVPDTKTNSLLLRGPESIQRIARSLLQSVDRETTKPHPVAQSAPVVRSYRCDPSQVSVRVGIIREMDGGRGQIKVTAVPGTGQLLVLARPEAHDRIRARFGGTQEDSESEGANQSGGSQGSHQSDVALRRLPQAVGGSAGRSDGLPGPAVDREALVARGDRVIPIRSGQAMDLEQRILALFSGRLQRVGQGNRVAYRLVLANRPPLEFQFDPERNTVLARGPEAVVAQFTQLITALDRSGVRGLRTEAVAVQRTDPAQLGQTVNAFRGGESRNKVAPISPQSKSERSGRPPRPGLNDQSRHDPHRGAVRLINYMFQTQDGQAVAGDEASSDDRTVPSITGLQDLDIQTLPDLDVIIMRGRDQDVRQLTEIIRELERISAETKPKIFIYQLKHTQGESIKQIVDQVQQDLIAARQGRVSITPLTKPNALLLIGWGEAVDSIKELIARLDRPVAPESQFSVFSLRNASAADVQRTITGFFASRTGLGPKVQVEVDVRTNSLIAYAAPRDMEEVRRLVDQLDVVKSGAVNRAQIFHIRNALAVDIATTLQEALAAASSGQAGRSAVMELMTVDEHGREILRSGMLNDIRVTPNPRVNTLIVTGPPEAMELIGAFIDQLDQAGDQAQIKVFRIVNGDAYSLATVLRSLMPNQIGQAIGPQLPVTMQDDSLAPLRFSVEVRSNSIIAIGSEGDLRIVEALLARLDESESMNRRNAVYLLKNSPAIDVATAVNEFLRSRRQLLIAEPGQANPCQDLEREVIVVPEPVGNRLIVSATPRYFDEITQLIERLDEPPPQVVIQVLIAEVRLTDADQLGFELGLQDSLLFDRSLLGDLVTTTQTGQISDPNGILTSTQEIIQAASNTPGFDFNNNPLGNSGSTSSVNTASRVAGQALSNFELGRTDNELGYGGLVLSASSRNVSILIRALEEARRIRVLSRPLIRTLDNQPAFIQVGQRVPRIVGSTVNTNGQSNSVTLENVGLILGVTPRISPDGNVVMEIDAEKSKIGPEEEGIPVSVSIDGTVIRSPRVDTITAQATVSAADGETVILGGMIDSHKEALDRRVPYLAELPVLGSLFKYTSHVERRSELLIILTPHVIRKPEDGARLKHAEFARMSWCAADVYDIQGDIGMSLQPSVDLPVEGIDQMETIYPDSDPRGEGVGSSVLSPENAPARPLPQPAEPDNRRLQEIRRPAPPAAGGTSSGGRASPLPLNVPTGWPNGLQPPGNPQGPQAEVSSRWPPPAMAYPPAQTPTPTYVR